MMTSEALSFHPNQLVQHLGKVPQEFTKSDLIEFIEANRIEMLNFRFVAGDGRLKTLNFVISSKDQLESLLTAGERVDGSSLFDHIDAAHSDLYIIPRYRTAYVNPCATTPTLDILCSYYTSEGEPLPNAPEYIVRRAQEVLRRETGFELMAMGELEYYVIAPAAPETKRLYPLAPQRGYQESAPFVQWEQMRTEAMRAIAAAGGRIKYGHSEVGSISTGKYHMEQHEIEFLPVPITEAADQIVIAKWILRMIGYKYGVTVSFSPKVYAGHAGSGLHIHTKLMKDKTNAMIHDGALNERALRVIAGYLTLAPSLTAFGNTVPVSYLRLVPNQEAPTDISWGERNRSVLVRVPLGWLEPTAMNADANRGNEELPRGDTGTPYERQTLEFRLADGSAKIHLLLAALAVAARHGLANENALSLANRLRVGDEGGAEGPAATSKQVRPLPRSCGESARRLIEDRAVYESCGVFSPVVIDGIAAELRAYDDTDWSKTMMSDEEARSRMIERYLHCL